MPHVTVGIDVGGSTTKIVGFHDGGELITPAFVRATDPVTSVYGALGKFTTENGLSLSDLRKIMVTGVGSSFLGEALYSCPCQRVDEFSCVGRGGLYLTRLKRAVTVSMGTGTALVFADGGGGGQFRYLGGTGVGGGTVVGLAKQMLGIENIEHLVELAEQGNLSRIDLRISDITAPDGRLDLPGNMTASNFGKLSDLASREDIALGILNIVFETIGMMAVFAARAAEGCDVVLTGHLSTLPKVKEIFAGLEAMFGIRFLVPSLAQFATVIGAALSGMDPRPA